ncbi:MAG: hypothetical protein EAX96_17265 [Candidatus Lokiarchaeota archaeon]|nr:hypothetical protein [Candidatus Lokiarchaeota archaeon]
MINNLFGPSIHLIILDMFLEHPREMMNLREVARRIDKNPGSISRVMPILVENKFLTQVKVGKKMYVFKLNEENEYIKLIIEFNEKLKEIEKKKE